MGARLYEILDEAALAGRRALRAALRRRADRYVRSGPHLERWTFRRSRGAVVAALSAPHDADATRALCRALHRDWKTARALPRHITGRTMRVDELRSLFACECMLYRRQAASTDAQKTMISYLRQLASAAE